MWEESYETLLNAVNEEELETIEMIKGPIQEIGKNEVEREIKRMKNSKANGPLKVCIKIFNIKSIHL